jgi:hypothetical protein
MHVGLVARIFLQCSVTSTKLVFTSTLKTFLPALAGCAVPVMSGCLVTVVVDPAGPTVAVLSTRLPPEMEYVWFAAKTSAVIPAMGGLKVIETAMVDVAFETGKSTPDSDQFWFKTGRPPSAVTSMRGAVEEGRARR